MKFKRQIIKENLQSKNSDPIKEYRKLANIDESIEITEDTIDDFALKSVSRKYNIQPYDLKHMILGEAVTIDQAARELEAETLAAENKNQVEKVLDRALHIARHKAKNGDRSDFPNILLISDAGFGKTDMVRQWAAKNGINLVQKNLGTMGPEAFGGILSKDSNDPRYATRLGTNEMIRSLSKPNSVLFLDEYNRSKTEIRGAVLTLIQNHLVWDPTQENEERYLNNFLFTIAAINPPNTSYKGAKEVDPAENSRFFSLNIMPDPMEHLRYLTSFYNRELQNADDEEKVEIQGRLNLAKTILSSPEFRYDSGVDIDDHSDDPDYKPLNYRSFKLALDYSDGTKEDFLNVWNHYCNHDKKKVIEGILRNYKDIDDKANDALKAGTSSKVFSQEKSDRAKLKDMFSELNI